MTTPCWTAPPVPSMRLASVRTIVCAAMPTGATPATSPGPDRSGTPSSHATSADRVPPPSGFVVAFDGRKKGSESSTAYGRPEPAVLGVAQSRPPEGSGEHRSLRISSSSSRPSSRDITGAGTGGGPEPGALGGINKPFRTASASIASVGIALMIRPRVPWMELQHPFPARQRSEHAANTPQEPYSTSTNRSRPSTWTACRAPLGHTTSIRAKSSIDDAAPRPIVTTGSTWLW